MIDRENYDDYDVILTLEEVEEIMKYEWECLSEDEQDYRCHINEPLFLDYVYSYMIRNNLDKILLNQYTYKYEKI
jgi:hypothetical protein